MWVLQQWCMFESVVEAGLLHGLLVSVYASVFPRRGLARSPFRNAAVPTILNAAIRLRIVTLQLRLDDSDGNNVRALTPQAPSKRGFSGHGDKLPVCLRTYRNSTTSGRVRADVAGDRLRRQAQSYRFRPYQKSEKAGRLESAADRSGHNAAVSTATSMQ